MTKYAQIASLASAHSERFFEHREKCRQVALLICGQLSAYLEAPPNTLEFVEINDELKTNYKPIHEPMMQQGRDGYWYFGLRVHFADPKHRGFSDSILKFGVKVEGTNCSMKLDSTFTVNLLDTKTLNPVFDDVMRGYECYYSMNPSAIPRVAGFIQSPTK